MKKINPFLVYILLLLTIITGIIIGSQISTNIKLNTIQTHQSNATLQLESINFELGITAEELHYMREWYDKEVNDQ